MIDLQDIGVKFNRGSIDEIDALKNVTLHIRPHEFVTIIGTNGSGKSTLLNVLAGTVEPCQGSILLEGKEISRKKDFQRAAWMSRVFQNPYAGTAPGMTLAENLLMAGLRGKPRYPKISLTKNLREEFRNRLAPLEMQLENRLDHVISTLSGGQRQAVTLLMAVMQTPKVLLLDEHTAALDPKTAAQVVRLTQRFVSESGLATIMVTHSMKQALELGSRTIMMHHGRIIDDMDMAEKRNLTVEDLLNKFEDIRKQEKLTPDLVQKLRQQYL
jgi:putative ABC transport system ATP-binding protein